MEYFLKHILLVISSYTYPKPLFILIQTKIDLMIRNNGKGCTFTSVTPNDNKIDVLGGCIFIIKSCYVFFYIAFNSPLNSLTVYY